MSTVPHQSEDPTDSPPVDYAPGWRPEPGDKIRIQLGMVSTRVGDFDPYPIYTGKLVTGSKARIADGRTDDEVAVHATRSQLRVRLENAELQPGDVISIVYDGPPLGSAKSERYRVAKQSENGWVEIPYVGDGGKRPTPDDLPADTEDFDPPARKLHRPLEEDPGPDREDPGRADEDAFG